MSVFKEYRARLRKETWCIDIRIDGHRYRDSGFASKREAEDAVAQLRSSILRGKYDLPTERPVILLRELVAERVRDLDDTNKHHRNVRTVLERFRDFFPFEKEVASLTSADCLAYKRERVTRGKLKPNSINRELEAVTAMCRAAGLYFPSLENWKPPAMPYERVGERGRERVLSDDEVARLLKKMREPRRRREQPASVRTRHAVADMVQVALMTGMRLGEIQKLRWEWVDLKAGVVTLPADATKTKTARVVPVSAALRAILDRRRAAALSPALVFTNDRGTLGIGRTKVYRCLRRESERAKVSYGRNAEGGFCFHDTRHTATTALLHGGADVATTSEILGHSQRTMTLRYAHSTLESKRRAGEILGRFGENLDAKSPANSEGD